MECRCGIDEGIKKERIAQEALLLASCFLFGIIIANIFQLINSQRNTGWMKE